MKCLEPSIFYRENHHMQAISEQIAGNHKIPENALFSIKLDESYLI